ncbi:MAG TPA: putative lipid II flippase FtsW [Steroidobacteraceae bacterium]|nr:putative lipid II flippase FtsW [Steroidobacteraceae bacterium]
MNAGSLRIDAVLVALLAATVLFGLVMVTSASISMASQESAANSFAYLEKQLLFLAAGMAAGAVAFCVRSEQLERLSVPLLFIGLALLLVVAVPGVGHRSHGSRRWLQLGGFAFQASELARLLVLIYVASYAVRKEQELRGTLSGLVKPLGVLLLAGGLLLAEPDMGAATVLFATGFIMLFLAGGRLRYMTVMVLCAAALFTILAESSGYRRARITAFLHPFDDPFHSGFQLVQSLIAIGRGQLFGVGLGESVQKLFYLPEAHSDFIFAVLAEELGLVGVLLTLSLFLALAWRSVHIARLAHAVGLKFGAYIAAGFGVWIGVQALINIGVNMGVLPTKGLTLPLMSYGGSSLVVALVWAAIVLRVYHEATQPSRSAAASPREAA